MIQQLIHEVTGHSYTKEVESYVLSVEDAKFFVAGYNNEVGKAYRRWLIQCEKKLDQTNLLIKQIMSDEVICRRVLQLADEKQNQLYYHH